MADDATLWRCAGLDQRAADLGPGASPDCQAGPSAPLGPQAPRTSPHNFYICIYGISLPEPVDLWKSIMLEALTTGGKDGPLTCPCPCGVDDCPYAARTAPEHAGGHTGGAQEVQRAQDLPRRRGLGELPSPFSPPRTALCCVPAAYRAIIKGIALFPTLNGVL